MKYRAVVITVSDSCARGERDDHSGPALRKALGEANVEVEASEVVPDDLEAIREVLRRCVSAEVQLVVTTGGTGFGLRDVTPEATRAVIERPAPGIAELLRREGAAQTPLSWLSRGEAGIAGRTLIINLPGSPRAMRHAVETLKPILFHALDLLAGKQPH